MIDNYNSKKVRVYYFYIHEVIVNSYSFFSKTINLKGQKMGDPNTNIEINIFTDYYLRNFDSSIENINLETILLSSWII